MKLLETEKQKEEFEPFELKLLVETEGEARLLWHVFNRCNLKSALSSNNYGLDSGYYLEKASNQFANTGKISRYLSSKIKGGL